MMILNLEEQKLWERCAGFHGHTCGGLAIGFQAARRAAALLGLDGPEVTELFFTKRVKEKQ